MWSRFLECDTCNAWGLGECAITRECTVPKTQRNKSEKFGRSGDKLHLLHEGRSQ